MLDLMQMKLISWDRQTLDLSENYNGLLRSFISAIVRHLCHLRRRIFLRALQLVSADRVAVATAKPRRCTNEESRNASKYANLC